MPNHHNLIRVLVADDEPNVRDAYREVFEDPKLSSSRTMIRDLRAKVLGANPGDASANKDTSRRARFELVFCDGAETAVAAVKEACRANRPFAIAFLDMRMPPGPDGLWAAEAIRALDAEIEIVLCTAYSDVDPESIALRVPPADKLFYIEKPFHPFEVRQIATALGSKWRAERDLKLLAYFDTLTGLPNRESFRRRLIAILDTARSSDRPLAMLYIDLDNFKRINDTLGHSIGDELLCVAAERLRSSLRADDEVARTSVPAGRSVLARLGGDEFVVILTDLAVPADASAVAQRIINALMKPMQLEGHEILITPSVGIAVFPTDGASAGELSRHADLAMYFAKRNGPGQFAFYDPTMSAGALQRLTMETKLRGALERKEFWLQYQPQFDLQTGLIAGVEALLRWTTPDIGAVPPAEFIPIAEATGMIFPIGEWVLRAACAQQRAWADEGLPSISMAVNVSACQFTSAQFPALVARIVAETGIDPTVLELEITESALMDDEARSRETLTALKALGVTLSIDDFGTGYSNLARLREFPVDRLKIDRSFVAHIATRSSDSTIAEAIIAMAKTLKLDVVAEGVEDFQQLLQLQEHKCHLAQGYLLSRPLHSSECRKFLARLGAQLDGTRTQRLQRLIV
jgi:diguanylate cyclase (GGDEF)-like protein